MLRFSLSSSNLTTCCRMFLVEKLRLFFTLFLANYTNMLWTNGRPFLRVCRTKYSQGLLLKSGAFRANSTDQQLLTKSE